MVQLSPMSWLLIISATLIILFSIKLFLFFSGVFVNTNDLKTTNLFKIIKW